MRLKKGKWVGVELTADQKKAQAIWRRTNKRMMDLCDALRTCGPLTREAAHKRLDKCYDAMEKQRQRAVALFPEVEESFTIASGTLEL